MFKFNKFIIAATASLLMAVSGFANADGKIAYVDLERAVGNSDFAKERIKAYSSQPDVAESNKTLERLQAEGQKLVEKLRSEDAILSPEQKAELQKKVQGIQSDMQYEAKKLQQANAELNQSLFKEIGPRLGKAIDEIVSEDGIGMLIAKPDPRLGQMILHVDSSFDITAKVTARLNKK